MRVLTRWLAVVVLGLGVGFAVAAATELKLGRSNFEWPNADNDNAYFSWFAEVINETDRDVTVEVSAVLLDDDDRVVHTDRTRERISAGATVRVAHEGALAYDRAQDVVSYRFEVEEVTE